LQVQCQKRKQDISAKFRCEVARNGKDKKSEFYCPPQKNGVRVGETAKGESTTEYHVKNLSKIGPVKLQLHVGEVLRLQWPGKLDFSPF